MTALAVHPWPGPAPAPQDGLLVLFLRTDARRETARVQVRLAAREALAAALHRPLGDIGIDSTPGSPPRITLAGVACAIGCSFAHEDGYALAAINLHGAVGVDLMRVQDIPDWQAVARDYLGPAASAALHATSADERPRAFAQAWTRREAALKRCGQQLDEWQSDISDATIMLTLPVADLAASIALLPEKVILC
jgi:4'-phosphopantetheinyl transferase